MMRKNRLKIFSGHYDRVEKEFKSWMEKLEGGGYDVIIAHHSICPALDPVNGRPNHLCMTVMYVIRELESEGRPHN